MLFFSALLYIIQSETTVTSKTYKEVLKGDLKQYSLLNQSFDKYNKKMFFQVIGASSPWLEDTELMLDEMESHSILDSLKSQGIKIDYSRSIFKSFLYRPVNFFLGCMGVFGALGFLSMIYKSSQENHFKPTQYQSVKNQEESSTEVLTFDDVAGIDEVKDQIEEIVELFKDSSHIAEMGGKIPRGVLLAGPPGTGKTLLAKITASECGANFVSASGSEFVEMYVGVGARRIRDLFTKARNMAPCIIFIDEIDAVAGRRGVDNNSEREQTLNQLLVEMDGFNSKDNILVIAATNQIEKLDPAILRPGRFDRHIEVHNPDINGREKILNIYLNKTKIDDSVDVKAVAKMTSGFSGAMLANLVNEAILLASRNKKHKISQLDLVLSKDKITMGSERKLEVSEKDKLHTAYHEIGHALIGKVFNIGEISQVSIIPRGKALGVTQIEQKDILCLSKEQAIQQIAMMMGGRVAERMFFNHLSTGASNDLQRSYNLARNIITSWGMSSLGPFAIDEQSYKFLSENTKQKIDAEIFEIVKEAEKLAEDVLTKNIKIVKKLSVLLFEKEVLYNEEFNSHTKKLKV